VAFSDLQSENLGKRICNPPFRKKKGTDLLDSKPRIVGDLTFVKASVNTVNGLVGVNWKKADRSLTMDVTLPPNSSGKVSIPKMQMNNVTITESDNILWKNGSYVGNVVGITDGYEIEDFITFDVGSGSYAFQISGKK
jgi:alpha-L-rhamnosidase